MASRKKKITVELEFDTENLQWNGFINGKVYGSHRWERRAFASASKAYMKEKNLRSESLLFSAKIRWTKEMKIATKAFKETQENYRRTKEEYEIFCGQYIAACKDSGLSTSGALEMAQVANNTAHSYMEKAGGAEAAAKKMWKVLGLKVNGVIGKLSPRTLGVGSTMSGKIIDNWSAYEDDD